MPATTPDQPDPVDPATRETVRITVQPQKTEAGGDLAHRPTVRLPRQRPGGTRKQRRAPLPVAAAVATVWAAVLSYLPVAVVMSLTRLADDAGSLPGAARVGLAGWLLGHGVPLDTPAGPIGLAPLALGVFAAWRVSRAGVHVARAIGARHHGSPAQALAVAGTVGIGYGVLGLLGAVILNTGDVSASPLRAGLTFAAFGAVAALVGALRTTAALRVLARRIPAVLRDGVRTGVVAAFLVLGAGAGLAGLAIALGGGHASDIIGAYRTGVAGQAGITLVCVAYAPNAAVWAAAYLLGPGFAVGTDTVVRTTEVSVGALPAVPLLAGLPDGPLGGAGAALLALPVVAGMLAGWLQARRMARADRAVRWPRVLGAALLAGPVAGLVLGGAAVLSGGSLGGGRMADIGPVAWQVAALAAGIVAVGTLIGATATRIFTP
ncbi:cell division protein PerM [Phytohabitans rumicis]|uniref:Integral membrane protein n=1 Tax=Phytohabitans rumicis TaxID=1076125 RepID=A0A6V8L6P3_9ACTN|nr:DUF6350 family protein [Phytohabitans rumicis]GFJ89687.1 hypothetical protein Prum_033290 [Phytohabitans rumicis]